MMIAPSKKPKAQAAAEFLESERETFIRAARAYLAEYRQRHPFGFCSLPQMWRGVAEPAGLSIGRYHDALREMVARRLVRLHPWTQAAYQLKDEQYALLSGQEIKFYVELLEAGRPAPKAA